MTQRVPLHPNELKPVSDFIRSCYKQSEIGDLQFLECLDDCLKDLGYIRTGETASVARTLDYLYENVFLISGVPRALRSGAALLLMLGYAEGINTWIDIHSVIIEIVTFVRAESTSSMNCLYRYLIWFVFEPQFNDQDGCLALALGAILLGLHVQHATARQANDMILEFKVNSATADSLHPLDLWLRVFATSRDEIVKGSTVIAELIHKLRST